MSNRIDIKIISATPDPMDVIAIAAGTSYGKSDSRHSRVRNCFQAGHLSVFEHASVTFRVSGISRACSHQLVRHRLASFVQKSQRYTKIDTKTNDWYVKPDSFDEEDRDEGYFDSWTYSEWFDLCMEQCAEDYQFALASGIKPEDARYLLPEACKTELTVTMNVRELFHFLDLRTDSHAQWEIRDMAFILIDRIREISGQWCSVIELWDERGGA